MRTLDDDMADAIDSDANVLISGESGAGKKGVARAIHQRSRRGPAPLVIAKCQDTSETRFQSRRGSAGTRPFEESVLQATGIGTLLIDDIQRISPTLQMKLLRFTENETRDRSALRLMTAASQDLFARVRSDQFRSDLFYRLNVVHLKIPALRDRTEDIPILLRHYLSLYTTGDPSRLSTAALQRLVAYPWPGNVPELKAIAKALAARNLRRRIEPNDLPSHIGSDRWPDAAAS